MLALRVIHLEALSVKQLSSNKRIQTKLESILNTIVKIVNFIKCDGHSTSSRIFQKVFEEMHADHVTPLLHTDVRYLTGAKFWLVFSDCDGKVLHFVNNKIISLQLISMILDWFPN